MKAIKTFKTNLNYIINLKFITNTLPTKLLSAFLQYLFTLKKTQKNQVLYIFLQKVIAY